ncbi:hypothetical protein ABLN72_13545 [Mycobacterium tuberculosis]
MFGLPRHPNTSLFFAFIVKRFRVFRAPLHWLTIGRCLGRPSGHTELGEPRVPRLRRRPDGLRG